MTVMINWDKHWTEKKIDKAEVEGERCFSEAKLIPVLKREFGTLDGLKSIEIGSGMGTDSLIMAAYGADVTLVDYSHAALGKAQALFDLYGFKAKMVKADVLSLDGSLKGKFDVAMSYGLAEHFEGAECTDIFKAHLDLVRNGGVIIVSVPNCLCPSYRVVKVAKRWDEVPFTKGQLRHICEELNVEILSLFGAGLASFHDQIANTILESTFGWKVRIRLPNVPSFVDNLWGYALVLIGRKKPQN